MTLRRPGRTSSRIGYLGLGLERRRPGREPAPPRSTAWAPRGIAVEAVSGGYETEPVGEILDQPDFLNLAVRIGTDLEPEELLDACKAIEADAGRDFDAPRHSPRPVDVDLLLLGDVELSTERLTLPHREVTARRFVLVPLLELDPELRLPDGTSLADGLGCARRGRARRADRPTWSAGRGLTGSGRERLQPGRREARRGVAGEVGDEAAGEIAGRPALDERPQVVHRHQQRDARRDLQVGGVRRIAADRRRRRCSSSTRSISPGSAARSAIAWASVGLVEARRELRDRRRGLRRHRRRAGRASRPRGSSGSARGPCSSRFQTSRRGHLLEHLVAPLLRLLDLRAGGGIGGEQRRLRHEAVELAGDRPAALDPVAVDPQRRDRHAGEARRPAGSASRATATRSIARVVDALALEHQPRGPAGVGCGNREQASLHGPANLHACRSAAVATIARCSRRRRRQHPDPRRRLRRRRPRRRLAPRHPRRLDRRRARARARRARCSSAASTGTTWTGLIVSTVVPRLGPEYERLCDEHLARPLPARRPRGQDRDGDPDRQPARARLRPARQRRLRLRADRRPLPLGRLRDVDQRRRRLRRRRVPRRRHRSGPRGLDRSALLAGGEAAADSSSPSPSRRSAGTRRRRCSPASPTGSPASSTASSCGCVDELGADARR